MNEKITIRVFAFLIFGFAKLPFGKTQIGKTRNRLPFHFAEFFYASIFQNFNYFHVSLSKYLEHKLMLKLTILGAELVLKFILSEPRSDTWPMFAPANSIVETWVTWTSNLKIWARNLLAENLPSVSCEFPTVMVLRGHFQSLYLPLGTQLLDTFERDLGEDMTDEILP